MQDTHSLEQHKPEMEPTPHLSLLPLLLKATLLSLVIFSLLMVLTAAGAGLFVYAKIRTFTTAANTSFSELRTTLESGWKTPVTQTENHKNILILGLDSLQTRGNVPPLSDTMMLVSLNLETGKIKTLPLPRDLWSPEYQTKINALYAYGIERYPTQPEKFPQEVIQEMTQVPIHHVVPLSLDQVAQAIDLLGGIEVHVEQGFVDEEFPRADVDVTVERDPAKLYERVEFTAGTEVMSGERALKYIRSRHSVGDEGDDTARSRRQQQVISALLQKATDTQLLTNPQTLGSLYRFYADTFARYISMPEAIATGKALLPHRQAISFEGNSLSIYPEDKNGVITHPSVQQYQNQWVYVVRNPITFHAEVRKKLLDKP